MSPTLFPDPGPDPAEPGGVPPGQDPPGPEQGLYLCTPAEQLTLSGFAQNGEADTMPPGPLLATIVDTVTGDDGTGLSGCSDDQLLGVISGVRRQQARDEWLLLAAVGEFARRAGPEGEFAADELGDELHMSRFSAAGQMDYATTVARRLPRLFAALRAGLIQPFQLRIIEEETRILSDADALRADALLAAAAAGMTYGELRYAARKLVLTLDPDAVRKHKEAARRNTEVRRFREESGNGGMIARELPSAEVLASWQHIEQRALDLRAAGLDGTLEELQARAFLDLLQERDTRPQPTTPDPAASDLAAAGPADADPGTVTATTGDPARHAPGGDSPSPDPDQSASPRRGPQHAGHDPDGPGEHADPSGAGNGPGGPGGPASGHGPGAPGSGPGGPGPGPRPGHGAGPRLAAHVTITIPWQTYQGRADTPGDADGFGPVDGDDARDLAAAAARHPRTRWCVTALNPDGTAAAHACLGRHPPPGTGPPGQLPVLTAPLTPITRGPCDHAHGQVGYHPGRRLAHLIRARNAKCTAPGCGRPAARCDLDHTTAYDEGGRTCECNLAPLCRHHHRCKQAQGWHLEQPEPGVLVWRAPSGRSYATGPTRYAV